MKHACRWLQLGLTLAVFGALPACSTPGPAVQQTKYAKLKSTRTFEYDFPTTWNGIEKAFANMKVVDRDPSKVDALEMKKLRKRTLETDWVYTQSRDKYHEIKVNGFPKRVPLQARIKYTVIAAGQIGGVDVTVNAKEELERLKADGSPDGYEEVENIDTSRTSEMLDRINLAILSAAP